MEYETSMIVVVKSREQVGLTPLENVQRSTVAFTVTKG